MERRPYVESLRRPPRRLKVVYDQPEVSRMQAPDLLRRALDQPLEFVFGSLHGGRLLRRLTDMALSCRPPVNVPSLDRRPPGESTPEPGGRRLGSLAGPEVAAGQLQCLVRQQPREA